MPTYLSPGVYVEEVSTGTKPIGMVGTSIAAFLGVVPIKDARLNEAYACNNWSQFCKEFVGEDSSITPLACAVFGFFLNGGGRCYIVNVGESKGIVGDARKRSGIRCLETIDEIAIVAAPGYCDAISYDALLSHCEKLQDRFAILDAPLKVDNVDSLKEVAQVTKGGASTGEDAPSKSSKSKGMRCRTSDSGYGAYYFPWLICSDPFNSTETIPTPPSGHLAGIYARTDTNYGVHKAPANESVRGSVGLTYSVTREEQGELNRKSVNVIRKFPDGIRVWGARTVAEEANEWRYISLRRACNMIKESIQEGTRWTVFEPNDEMTWKSVERDCRAFLKRCWLDRVLMGASPEEAFFVKCDAENNPQEVRDAGQLIAEIGIALVKPAEFVIFRIGQWAGDSETEAASAAGG